MGGFDPPWRQILPDYYSLLQTVGLQCCFCKTETAQPRGWVELGDSMHINRYSIGKASSDPMCSVLGTPFHEGWVAQQWPQVGLPPFNAVKSTTKGPLLSPKSHIRAHQPRSRDRLRHSVRGAARSSEKDDILFPHFRENTSRLQSVTNCMENVLFFARRKLHNLGAGLS